MFYNKSIIKGIKDTGYISKEVSDLVDKAKEAFIMPNEIIAGNELEVYYSPVFQICMSNKKILSIFNSLSKVITKAMRIYERIRR